MSLKRLKILNDDRCWVGPLGKGGGGVLKYLFTLGVNGGPIKISNASNKSFVNRLLLGVSLISLVTLLEEDLSIFIKYQIYTPAVKN